MILNVPKAMFSVEILQYHIVQFLAWIVRLSIPLSMTDEERAKEQKKDADRKRRKRLEEAAGARTVSDLEERCKKRENVGNARGIQRENSLHSKFHS